MNKCLKITFDGPAPLSFMQNIVQKYAKEYELEGVAQAIEGNKKVRVIVFGDKDNVENFLDVLYKGSKDFIPENIEVEPYVKDKDFRGVFRIIE